MSNAVLAVQLIEAESRDALIGADSLEDKLNIAFKAAKNHWMVTDDQEQFSGALGAVFHHVEGEDKERLESEMGLLKSLNAAMSGVSVNMPEIDYEPIGLIGMWKNIGDL